MMSTKNLVVFASMNLLQKVKFVSQFVGTSFMTSASSVGLRLNLKREMKLTAPSVDRSSKGTIKLIGGSKYDLI